MAPAVYFVDSPAREAALRLRREMDRAFGEDPIDAGLRTAHRSGHATAVGEFVLEGLTALLDAKPRSGAIDAAVERAQAGRRADV
jgi:hypothetical protein